MSKSLKDGLTEEIFDFGTYLGDLTYIDLRSTSLEPDEYGELTEVKKRVYDVRSDGQRTILHISIPAETQLVNIPRGTPVKLVSPLLSFMAQRFNPDAIPYIYAENIVPLGQAQTAQPAQPQGQKQNSSTQDDKK